MTGTRLIDRYKIVQGLSPQVPSTSTSLWVDMALYSHVTFVFSVANASGVTGSAITFNQATAQAGTGSKSLPFTTYFQNLTAGSGDTFTQQTASGNTFTTLTTSSANAVYVVEFQDTDLDLNNSFTSVQAALATAVNATIDVIVILYPRFGGNFAAMPTSLA